MLTLNLSALLKNQFYWVYVLIALTNLTSHTTFAQFYIQNTVGGVPCAGTILAFELRGGTATVDAWTIFGNNYTIITNEGTRIVVRWNSAQVRAGVQAEFSYYPTSDPNEPGGLPMLDVASLTFTVPELPNAAVSPSGTETICSTCTKPIDASPFNNGYSYTWLKNGSPIPGATSSSYDASAGGTYRVIVAKDGCIKTSDNSCTIIKNRPPVVSAGADQAIVLPVNSIILYGSGADPDGGAMTYLWTRVSGSNSVVINDGTTLTPTITGLHPGTWDFRLTATDNYGESVFDEVRIITTAPANNYNYIRETTLLTPKTNEDEIGALIVEQKSENTTYYDGLGRPMQQVAWQASRQRQDIVQPVVYDAYGREHKKYLPFTAQGDGRYKPNNEIIDASTGQYTGIAQSFYSTVTDNIADDAKPYAETIFETSPLNRVVKQGAPGEAWQPNADVNSTDDKTIKKKYEFNQAGEVLFFTYDGNTGSLLLAADEHYKANQLYANKTYDENSNEIIEYADKEGRTVCKKVQYGKENNIKLYACTYYIYDDLGNLVVVLPPEAVKTLVQE